MPRFKLDIQYDGTNYCGWQTQKDSKTIQKKLETILSSFNGKNSVKLSGSGRTDSGVHALGQSAHFDLNTDLDTCTLKKALNAKCPPDIYISDCQVVKPDFHARYSAIKRTYIYQCFIGTNPLFKNQCWYIPNPDINLLNNVSKTLLGTHDFLSFSKWNKDVKSTVCEIFHSRWTIKNKMVIFTITGNRFLHHMVRYITGTLIAVAQSKILEEDFINLLTSPKKNVSIFKAPPEGLILKKVEYGF
jgi:tRNA pseudouridine38-40 synthase